MQVCLYSEPPEKPQTVYGHHSAGWVALSGGAVVQEVIGTYNTMVTSIISIIFMLIVIVIIVTMIHIYQLSKEVWYVKLIRFSPIDFLNKTGCNFMMDFSVNAIITMMMLIKTIPVVFFLLFQRAFQEVVNCPTW